jgi:hypothetical protein
VALGEEYTGSNGSWGTEFSLTAHSTSLPSQTSDGLYAPWIDVANLARGDEYIIRAYETVVSGGTKRLYFSHVIPGWGLPARKLFTIPPAMLLHGWDFTLQRIAGSDRTIEYSVKGIEGAVTEYDSGTDTISTSEYFLASDSTSISKQTEVGLYQLFMDVNALAKGDDFRVNLWEEVRGASSTEQAVRLANLTGVRSHKVYATPTLELLNGWEFSMQRRTGADRSVPWSIRKVA